MEERSFNVVSTGTGGVLRNTLINREDTQIRIIIQ